MIDEVMYTSRLCRAAQTARAQHRAMPGKFGII